MIEAERLRADGGPVERGARSRRGIVPGGGGRVAQYRSNASPMAARAASSAVHPLPVVVRSLGGSVAQSSRNCVFAQNGERDMRRLRFAGRARHREHGAHDACFVVHEWP